MASWNFYFSLSTSGILTLVGNTNKDGLESIYTGRYYQNRSIAEAVAAKDSTQAECISIGTFITGPRLAERHAGICFVLCLLVNQIQPTCRERTKGLARRSSNADLENRVQYGLPLFGRQRRLCMLSWGTLLLWGMNSSWNVSVYIEMYKRAMQIHGYN